MLTTRRRRIATIVVARTLRKYYPVGIDTTSLISTGYVRRLYGTVDKEHLINSRSCETIAHW
jgi:hypothetical protein